MIESLSHRYDYVHHHMEVPQSQESHQLTPQSTLCTYNSQLVFSYAKYKQLNTVILIRGSTRTIQVTHFVVDDQEVLEGKFNYTTTPSFEPFFRHLIGSSSTGRPLLGFVDDDRSFKKKYLDTHDRSFNQHIQLDWVTIANVGRSGSSEK